MKEQPDIDVVKSALEEALSEQQEPMPGRPMLETALLLLQELRARRNAETLRDEDINSVIYIECPAECSYRLRAACAAMGVDPVSALESLKFALKADRAALMKFRAALVDFDALVAGMEQVKKGESYLGPDFTRDIEAARARLDELSSATG